MNKKITRRVVLGTAIAGLAAGPFVIRAWRKKQVKDLEEIPYMTLNDIQKLPPPDPTPLPYNDLFNGWNTVRQRFQTPLPLTNDGHKIVTLKPDLSVPKQWNFLMLQTRVQGTAFQLEDYLATNGKGMLFETIEGTVKTGNDEFIATVSDHLLHSIAHKDGPTKSTTNVTVNGDRVLSFSRTQESPFFIQSVTKCSAPVTLTYVLRSDVNSVDIPLLFMKDLSYQKADTPEKKQIIELTSKLSPALSYFFVTTDWTVNSQFVLPARRAFQGHWRSDTFTLTSLKTLNNKTVAEVVMEQSLDSKEQIRSYYQALAQKCLQELTPKDWTPFSEKNKKQMMSALQEAEKNYEKMIEMYLKQQNYRYVKSTWHIDLVSGLVLRYESYKKNLAPNGCSQFDLFQMIES
ncbi:MAG: hypothetical protein LBE12_20975 [Planctomycetaceae bacterium]|jgi:hypothetical protein|nr:hypothetical protein [Planctomycetaceae bacterium]